ncbi:MAG TPA: AAA family ATPase [Micromonosporaceae bacterium]|nr:AAA family ATPase [Micromonosporaceae bacterium]
MTGRRPTVVVLAGVPGAGKTTLATGLARATGWSLVSRDVIRFAMFDPCRFTDVEKHASFAALVLAVEANLRLGRCCVVEGMPFSRVGELERIEGVTTANRAYFLAFLLELPLAEAARRVGLESSGTGIGRETSLDRVPLLVYEVAGRMRQFGPEVVRLDGQQLPERLVEQVLARLAELG